MTSAFDIYVSRVAHQTNGAIKVLTVISALLFSMTAIISFFGTSFRVSFLYGPQAFVVMVSLMVVTAVALISVFRAQGWM